MIVLNDKSNGLSIVLQPDHAATSAQMARAWLAPTFMPDAVRRRLVDATARHDDGWRGTEVEPALDERGRPLDFMNLPTAGHVSIWRRSVALAEDDPYIQLLIAAHARWLYSKHSKADTPEEVEQAQQLMDDLGAQMDECIERLRGGSAEEIAAVRPDQLEMARRLLSLWDAMSLLLLGALPARTREQTEPMAFGDETSSLNMEVNGNGAIVSPWPFKQPTVELMTRVLILSQTTFSGHHAWRQALANAREHHVSWRLTP